MPFSSLRPVSLRFSSPRLANTSASALHLANLLNAALIAAWAMLLTGGVSMAIAVSNPCFEGADPDILSTREGWWIFPTSEGERAKDGFFCWFSPDMKNWSAHGPILKMSDIIWINDDKAPKHELWAPCICHIGDKYYLYFAIGPQHPTPSRIGAAVSDRVDGPYKDSGKPLVTGAADFEAIDPCVFVDQKSGKAYLYCGGSAGAELKAYELDRDMVTVKAEVPVETPKNFTEGACLTVCNGTYYLSYSHGRWYDDSYCVAYSTGPSPLGPWTYKGIILESNDRHAGPGHSTIYQDPKTSRWYIVYHRWNDAKKTGKMPGWRSVCIEPVEYDKAGNIKPISLSD